MQSYNDQKASDLVVLTEHAAFLALAYERKIFVAGIVYLVPAGETQDTFRVLRDLGMIETLLGRQHLSRVTPILMPRDQYVAPLSKNGFHLVHFPETGAKAVRILHKLVFSKSASMPDKARTYQIQKELVDEGKALSKTAAGSKLLTFLLNDGAALLKTLESLGTNIESESIIDMHSAQVIFEAVQELTRGQEQGNSIGIGADVEPILADDLSRVLDTLAQSKVARELAQTQLRSHEEQGV